MQRENDETVAYIGGFMLPDKNAAAHRVIANAKALRLLGYKVVLIGINDELEEKELSEFVHEGFSCYSLSYPRNFSGWIKRLFSIDSYIDIIKKEENVKSIILYNFPSIAMKRLLSYSKQHNIKCIGDVTEWYDCKISFRNIVGSLAKKLDNAYRMRFIHKKLHALIVISRFLESYYNGKLTVSCIPPLVDITEKKWNNSQKKETESELLKLVYAGSPGNKDSLEVIIRAICKAKRKCKLDIIGIEKKSFLEKNGKYACGADFETKVFFHGRLSHEETLKYVKNADYSVFFRSNKRSNQAGFPTKFSEAVSAGTRIMTNDVSNISEYIADGNNGLILKKISEEEIIKCIEGAETGKSTETETFHYVHFVTELAKIMK